MTGLCCTFCSDSSNLSRRGRRRTVTRSRTRSPWWSITSRVGQQRWSRCRVAAHSRQTGRSQGWQKSRSSWPAWREQRTGRQIRPRDFSSSRAWTEWDAVRFWRLQTGKRTDVHMWLKFSNHTSGRPATVREENRTNSWKLKIENRIEPELLQNKTFKTLHWA